MNLTKVFELDKQVTVNDEYNGEKYSVTVQGNAFTQSFFQGYKDAQTDVAPAELARILSDVIVSWDVEMHEGEPFLPTYANLLRVPSTFLWHLLGRIVDTWNGNEADKKKSASG